MIEGSRLLHLLVFCVCVQCRIMRDLAKVNAQGVGKSKGYAFVNFTRHEHALSVLRHLNNNADCFGPTKVRTVALYFMFHSYTSVRILLIL